MIGKEYGLKSTDQKVIKNVPIKSITHELREGNNKGKWFMAGWPLHLTEQLEFDGMMPNKCHGNKCLVVAT